MKNSLVVVVALGLIDVVVGSSFGVVTTEIRCGSKLNIYNG